MRKSVVAVIGIVAFASGFMLGGVTRKPASSGLPTAVEASRSALLAAAESGDYDDVQSLLPAGGGFRYTFGEPVEGGPIAYWQELERTTDELPLETLAAILRMPYTLSRGYYFWPFAYNVTDASDITAHERELLAPLGRLDRLFVEGTGYLGWRAAIAPNGTWVLFLAGD